MRYRAALTVPAGTLKATPATSTLKLSYGYITEVEVHFPAGCAGLVALAIDRYESQLYPLSSDAHFIGDDQTITLSDRFPLLDAPFSVRLRGWAPEAALDHTIYVDLSIEVPLATVAATPVTVELPEGF